MLPVTSGCEVALASRLGDFESKAEELKRPTVTTKYLGELEYALGSLLHLHLLIFKLFIVSS